MAVRRKMALGGASPSYAEMGEKKPNAKPATPLRYVCCSKCKRMGGTLINVGDRRNKVYIHPACQRR